MSESQSTILSLFCTYRFGPSFWGMNGQSRSEAARSLLEAVASAAEGVTVYTNGGAHVGFDLLLWSTIRITSSSSPAEFLSRRGPVEAPFRSWLEPGVVFWGMTRSSEYSRAKSSQTIDPFDDSRTQYLIVYPFTKTADWYLLAGDERQAMMNEHMTIGKQYRSIKQLLLYSFGLQDYDFVVVYEADDLDPFSRLVHELRATQGRQYTKADTPLQLGVRSDVESFVEGVG